MLQPMLQNMLKERCNLAWHTTKGVVQTYSLEVGKKGINPKRMKVSSATGSVPANALSPKGTWLTTYTPPQEGQNEQRNFYKMTMIEFAEHISSAISVADHTGLTARYDFSVELIPGARDVSERFDVYPLGLEFKKVEHAIDEVVIDHIDRPSAN